MHLERNFDSLPLLLLTSPHASLPFADFALCPFAIINYSHEYNYMLSPVSPSSKSVNLGLVWGTPNTHGDSSWNLLKIQVPRY